MGITSGDDIKLVAKLFIIWRLLLFVFLFLAIFLVPLQLNFLGGDLSSFLKTPYLWAWINFDGEHYLSIAYQGYRGLTYFYFPLYPLLTRYLTYFLAGNYVKYAISGLLVSNLSFLVGLIGLIKLIKVDYEKEIYFYTVVLLLLFPTSFYFASFYTESLFFALIIWSFYFARRGKWFLAGVLGGLSTLTRIIGLTLLPALLVEYYIVRRPLRGNPLKVLKLMFLLLIPLGLGVYMYFLKQRTGDPLEFFRSVSIFGPQRSSAFVLLPQVFYRYIFKILPKMNYGYFPVVFTTWLEFTTAIAFGLLGILGFLKLRFSYAVYLALGFLMPTLSGSFSSLPRYVLVLFPGFILGGIFISKTSCFKKFLFFSFLSVCLAMATILFTRGYWVS